ncbi:MAG: type II secretion system F family protein [Clostridiales bacterium]
MTKNFIFPAYLSVFCTELSLIIKAGMPLADGLLMLRDDDDDKQSREMFDQLYQCVETGAPLSQALRESNCFPAYMLNMVALAEKTGRLEDTLTGLSTYYQRQDRLTNNIKNALLYPAILLALMVVVIIILTTQVLPIFNDIFIRMGTQISPFATVVMHMGNHLAKVAAILIIAIAICAITIQIIRKTVVGREKISRLWHKIWGGKGIYGRISSARFASAMAMSIASGMNAEEALSSAAHVCGGVKAIDSKLALCDQLVTKGMRISEALCQSGLFGIRDSRMLMLAEKTGAMAGIMDDIAARSQQNIDDELDALIGYIEPALVLITSLIVGMVLLSVMLPLISIMSALG